MSTGLNEAGAFVEAVRNAIAALQEHFREEDTPPSVAQAAMLQLAARIAVDAKIHQKAFQDVCVAVHRAEWQRSQGKSMAKPEAS